ncbi:MAG: response regulator transcription factor [Candidatus Eremiobacteraeota bacterium]|nr:response regulator transcription factor [Candidatus Eremiobacteraeota bacterium]
MSSQPASTVKPQLLVIDHLGTIVNATNYNAFSQAGYAIDVAGSASKALSILKGPLPDLILLEASLPAQSGYDLEAFIQSLRQVPLILISDDGSLEAKLQGLILGADDYLANPYHLQELLIRISVLLRRWMNRHAGEAAITIDHLTIDPVRHQVFLKGKAVEVGFREFEVLSYFARNPHRFISRDELLNKVWNLPTPAITHVVEVCINGLRKKLLDRDKQLIQGVRGLGYSLGKPEE